MIIKGRRAMILHQATSYSNVWPLRANMEGRSPSPFSSRPSARSKEHPDTRCVKRVLPPSRNVAASSTRVSN
eukprot:scaffold65135_cov41-Tisochrysis_lutea.AAC.1